MTRPPATVLLVAFVTVSLIAGVMYAPSLPFMAAAFDVPQLTIQLTMTVYLIGYAIAQICVGALSDAFGRRPVMIAGLFVFMAASTVCAVAPNIEIMIASRFVQAFGASVGFVVSRAIVRDCHDTAESARHLAYLGMAAGLTPALSPLLGGVLQEWYGWNANFWFMTGIAALAVLGALVALPETHPPERRAPAGIGALAGGYAALARSPRFLSYAFGVATSTAVFFAFITGAPAVVIGAYDVAPSIYGFYAMAMPSGFITGNFVASLVTKRLGIDRSMHVGFGIAALGGLALLGAGLWGHFSAPVFVAPMVVIGFGSGLIVPNGFAGAVSFNPRLAGMASGLSGFLQMAAAAGASAVVGMIEMDSLLPYAVLLLCLVLLGAGVHAGLSLLAARVERTAAGGAEGSAG